jgi:hypothetical protein
MQETEIKLGDWQAHFSEVYDAAEHNTITLD